jgi:hypothetical protein
MYGQLGLTRLLDRPPGQGQNPVLVSEVNPDILQDNAQVLLRNAKYASFPIGSNCPTLVTDGRRRGRMGVAGRNQNESRHSDRQQTPHLSSTEFASPYTHRR